MPHGSPVTEARYEGRRVLVYALDSGWCLLAHVGNTQPNGMIGPLFLARLEDLDVEEVASE